MGVRSVLITGTSTGIGRACALRLDNAGWRVFAGVRRAADGEEMADRASDRLTPVTLDVADQGSIEEAASRLDGLLGSGGLHGLVNNAGVTVQGPLEFLALDELRRQFEVNVIGQLAVTQAMLPQVRAATGRIVMMSSIGGRARSLPFLGPYNASKYALEALGDSLRYELMKWRIRVSIVEPGSIATPIWEKGDRSFQPLLEALPPEGRERYGAMMERARKIAAAAGRRGIAPEKVALAVEHALTSDRPRVRYLVGTDARLRAALDPFIPNPLMDRFVARLLRL